MFKKVPSDIRSQGPPNLCQMSGQAQNLPTAWGPPRGMAPKATTPVPQVIWTFVLPTTFYPQGPHNLHYLPRQVQTLLPTAGAPPGLGTPQVAPAPQILQHFTLPGVFYLQAPPNLYHLLGPAQTLPTAWAPPVPLAPQAVPAGLQKAALSSSFHPQLSTPGTTIPSSSSAAPHHQGLEDPGHIQVTEVTEEMLTREAYRLFGYTLDTVGGSQGDPISSPTPGDIGDTARGRGRAVPPPAVLQSSQEHTEAAEHTAGTATPAGPPRGTDVPLATHVPSSPSAAPQLQAHPTADPAPPQEGPLQGALGIPGHSLGVLWGSQDVPRSSPAPGDMADTDSVTSPCNWDTALGQLLTPPDTSQISSDAQKLEQILSVLEPQEPWGEEDKDLPPPLPPSLPPSLPPPLPLSLSPSLPPSLPPPLPLSLSDFLQIQLSTSSTLPCLFSI
ncbi:proline-rich protein 36-like [Heliangelus exortis]|uniref:proline-rich protein 36-like n=1 Tax=Heliangelus exortis TaxID=472823 RepID=UPI003A959CF8